jgi:hypothetical protein
MTACRSCGAEVVFVKSAVSSSTMILDVEPTLRIVLLDRDVPNRLLPSANPANGSGMGPAVAKIVKTFTDHHATCPAAPDWKGRKR